MPPFNNRFSTFRSPGFTSAGVQEDETEPEPVPSVSVSPTSFLSSFAASPQGGGGSDGSGGSSTDTHTHDPTDLFGGFPAAIRGVLNPGQITTHDPNSVSAGVAEAAPAAAEAAQRGLVDAQDAGTNFGGGDPDSPSPGDTSPSPTGTGFGGHPSPGPGGQGEGAGASGAEGGTSGGGSMGGPGGPGARGGMGGGQGEGASGGSGDGGPGGVGGSSGGQTGAGFHHGGPVTGPDPAVQGEEFNAPVLEGEHMMDQVTVGFWGPEIMQMLQAVAQGGGPQLAQRLVTMIVEQAQQGGMAQNGTYGERQYGVPEQAPGAGVGGAGGAYARTPNYDEMPAYGGMPPEQAVTGGEYSAMPPGAMEMTSQNFTPPQSVYSGGGTQAGGSAAYGGPGNPSGPMMAYAGGQRGPQSHLANARYRR